MRCTAALLVLLTLAACGDEPADEVPEIRRPDADAPPAAAERWSGSLPERPSFEGGTKEAVRLDVPEALHAKPFDDRGSLVLNVRPDGAVVFKGAEWRLGDVTAEERRTALEALRAQVSAVTRGAAIPVLLLHADRAAPWSVIAALIADAVTWEPAPGRILFSALRPPDGWDHAFGGTWTVAGDESAEDKEAVPLRAAFSEGEKGPILDLRVGNRNWRVDRVRTFEDARFVETMNRIWRQAADYLQSELKGERWARFESASTKDGPWVAHVVTLLDLVQGTDVRTVYFPAEGVRLTLDAR